MIRQRQLLAQLIGHEENSWWKRARLKSWMLCSLGVLLIWDPWKSNFIEKGIYFFSSVIVIHLIFFIIGIRILFAVNDIAWDSCWNLHSCEPPDQFELLWVFSLDFPDLGFNFEPFLKKRSLFLKLFLDSGKYFLPVVFAVYFLLDVKLRVLEISMSPLASVLKNSTSYLVVSILHFLYSSIERHRVQCIHFDVLLDYF